MDWWKRTFGAKAALGLVALLVLAGCEGTKAYNPQEEKETNKQSVFGPGGFTLFGGPDKKKGVTEEGTSITVNSFLWRATIDTISFLPVNSADPFGGVIITDWYSPPDTPGERFKMNVYVLSRGLRADGIRVAVFRQVVDPQGTWRDAATPEKMNSDIEDAILTRARQLRNEATFH